MLRNTITENVILPVTDLLTGANFCKQLGGIRTAVTQSEDDLKNAANKKLFKVLQHATSKSQWYQPFKVDGIAEAEAEHWLKSFPILDKPSIRNNTASILTRDSAGLVRCASSGSSGYQTVTYMEKEQLSITRAIQVCWWEWAGYKLGDPIVQTGITPNRGFFKGMKDLLLNTYYFVAFSPDKEELRKSLLWAKKQQKPVLGGYASSLYAMALFAMEEGIDVQFKTAISWGDKLFPHYRAAVEKAFGCKIFETYGSSEGIMMASQFDHEYLYQMATNTYFEVVDDNGQPVPDGQLGHVIVTNLDAYAFPLIRYKIGDLAIKLPRHQYPANPALQLPILQKVVGRDTDIVRTPSGKMMVVHSFTGVFEHLPQISQFCVIQDNLQGIKIEFIRGSGFHIEILDKVRDQLMGYIKEPFDIEFIEVNHIAATPSGKPQMIISRLPKPDLNRAL